MFVCSCKAITESDLRALGARGILTGQALVEALGLDAPECCGRCMRDADQLAAIARGGRQPLELVGMSLSAAQEPR